MSHPATAPQPPKYWTFEPPELGVAVHAYMAGKDLTVGDVALMRAYLKQWVDSLVWEGYPSETDGGRQWLAELRERVRAITSPDDIAQCLSIMTARRMDPLQFPSAPARRGHWARSFDASKPRRAFFSGLRISEYFVGQRLGLHAPAKIQGGSNVMRSRTATVDPKATQQNGGQQ
jgi:hypothetical protein